MISFLEMVKQYPIGAKVNITEDGGENKTENQREVVGYEYYNGTGYLVFRNAEKINVEQITGSDPFFCPRYVSPKGIPPFLTGR